MKIYFSASIHAKAKLEENYQLIVSEVQAQGHSINASDVMDFSPESLKNLDEKTYLAYHKKVQENLKHADVLFVEASASSTSVGFMIACAVQAGKPVVIFFCGEQEPHLFRSLEKLNDKVQVVRYKDLAELKREIPYVLDFAAGVQDVRFNFFISPDLSTYLDWIARNRKVPRSVYLRQLIDEDMSTQEEFLNN